MFFIKIIFPVILIMGKRNFGGIIGKTFFNIEARDWFKKKINHADWHAHSAS